MCSLPSGPNTVGDRRYDARFRSLEVTFRDQMTTTSRRSPVPVDTGFDATNAPQVPQRAAANFGVRAQYDLSCLLVRFH
jgi:hypothetical protein